MNKPQDIPLSVAVITLIAVLGAWTYFSYLRFNPELVSSLGVAFGKNGSFWWMSIVVVSLDIAMIGSIIRRTIGLQRQGSRLKQIGDGKLGIKLITSDGIALVFGMISYVIFYFVFAGVLENFSFLPESVIAVTIQTLSISWAVFVFITLALIFRKFKNLKLSDDEVLREAPFRSKALVLGTMEIADERA